MKWGFKLFFFFALFLALIPVTVSGYRLAVQIDGMQKRSGELKADYLTKAAFAKAIALLRKKDWASSPDLFQETFIGLYSFRFLEFKEIEPKVFYVKAHIRSSFFVEKEVSKRIELKLLD